jgi:hypothetical protein
MFFLLCQWFSMQYMTWTKVSYNRTTICTRLLFVRWKGSCLFLFSWWRGCNWDDKNMLLITEFCDHFVPTEKATHTKKYVFLCILMFICIYIDIVLIGERVVMARCMAAVMHRWISPMLSLFAFRYHVFIMYKHTNTSHVFSAFLYHMVLGRDIPNLWVKRNFEWPLQLNSAFLMLPSWTLHALLVS